MQDDEEGWIAEFEASGESELRDRLYRGSGMHPEAKFHLAVRWLRESTEPSSTGRRRRLPRSEHNEITGFPQHSGKRRPCRDGGGGEIARFFASPQSEGLRLQH
jgi:hypothetical protein